MATFRYRAVNSRGGVRVGLVNGKSAEEVAASLAHNGLVVISVKNANTHAPAVSKKSLNTALLLFFKHLNILLTQKVPLVIALETLEATTTYPPLKRAIQQINFDIHNGEFFSAAISKHPNLFPDVVLACCYSAEKSGSLEISSKTVHDFLSLQDIFNKKLGKVLFYPCCVFTVLIAVIMVVLKYLMPVVGSFLVDSGKLNLSQRLLITASNLLTATKPAPPSLPEVGNAITHGAATVAQSGEASMAAFVAFCCLATGFFAAIFALWKIFVRRSFGEKRDAILWVQLLATLLISGSTMRDALKTAQKHSALKTKLAAMEQKILSGNSFSTALCGTKIQLPSLQSFVRIGESSGKLGEMLAKCVVFEQEQLSQRIDSFFERLSTTLLLVVGGVIAWLILNIFAPLYECFQMG